MQTSLLRPLGVLSALAVGCLGLRADVTPYCPASPNSTGGSAALAWSGPVNAAQGQLAVSGLPAGAPLAYVYGLAKQQTPFGSGQLCVAPVAFVLARRTADAGGVSTLDIALEGEPEDVRWLISGLLAGANFQVLYRDAGSPGALANTSDALEVVFE